MLENVRLTVGVLPWIVHTKRRRARLRGTHGIGESGRFLRLDGELVTRVGVTDHADGRIDEECSRDSLRRRFAAVGDDVTPVCTASPIE